jgi:hypothetical protein
MINVRPRMVARPYTFPVATGGWNASDALDAMKPDEAETLINWFPETTYNRLRRGFKAHCNTATNQPVESLASYSGATDELLAFSDDTWFEVTTSTPAALVTGLQSGPWDTLNYGTAGGQYLIACNGQDTPHVYNGATMVPAVNTVGGLASTLDLLTITSYGQRVYYSEAASLSVWYLPVGQYQGALTEYDLGPLCQMGGSIARISTWTRDNASAGANEMFVVVTTKGEVMVFVGDYPGGTTWQLSARFAVGEPVAGPNCVVRMGPDMILMCQDGFQPLAHYLQLGQSQAQAVALSKKIGNAVTTAVRTYQASVGWTALLYPTGNMLIFNIPNSNDDTVFAQYVVNTLTGAWCQWEGQNAWCWAMHDTRPFFGAVNGAVYEADTGVWDDGDYITAEYRGSYQYVAGEGLLKRVSMAQPVFQTTGPVTVNFGIDVDFNNTTLTSPAASVNFGATWDDAIWDDATWASGTTLQRQWVSTTGIGYAIAPHFIITTNSVVINLMSINLVIERGGFL